MGQRCRHEHEQQHTGDRQDTGDVPGEIGTTLKGAMRESKVCGSPRRVVTTSTRHVDTEEDMSRRCKALHPKCTQER